MRASGGRAILWAGVRDAMGFGGYLRTRLWELLFCAVASSALTYTLYSGFYACQPLQAWPIFVAVVGGCVVLTFALYGIAYRLATAVVGAVLLVCALFGGLAACAAMSPGGAPLSDVEGNYTLALGIASATCILVFLVSRKKAGAFALLVVGVAICALIEYLYWYGHLGALIAFLVGATGLVVFRGYQRNLVNSDSSGLAFTSVSVTALVLTALAVAISAGVYYAVIAPMNPPSQQVKLIIEHRSQEEVEIRGVGSVAGDTSGGDGNLANGDKQESDEEASDNLFDTVQNNVAELLGVDTDQTGDLGTTTTLQVISFLALIVAACVLALVLLVVLVRKLIRRRRYNRMTAGDNASSVRQLYLFFLDRFSRMKIPRPDQLSLDEYVRDFSATFEHFERFGCEGILASAGSLGVGDASESAALDESASESAALGESAGEGLGVGPVAGQQASGDPSTGAGAASIEVRGTGQDVRVGRSAFGRLTELYVWTTYGDGEPTDDDVRLFKDYYRVFYKNARRYVGRFKYLFKFFRL